MNKKQLVKKAEKLTSKFIESEKELDELLRALNRAERSKRSIEEKIGEPLDPEQENQIKVFYREKYYTVKDLFVFSYMINEKIETLNKMLDQLKKESNLTGE